MLKVKINSFSYIYGGIPEDESEHGGGFVFDCRFIKNPGREFRLMELTGKDKEVIEYLDNTPEMQKFLNNVYEIIDSTVSNYLSRDFSHIIISFGCTGGKHRSVYSAEKLKEHLYQRYNNKINLEINHFGIA